MFFFQNQKEYYSIFVESQQSTDNEQDDDSDDWLDSVGDWFGDIGSGLSDGFTSLVDSFEEGVDGIVEGITGGFDFIVDGILDGLKALFIPSDEYFSEKLQEFREEFAFVDTIAGVIEMIQEVFSSEEFGEFYVDLGASEGKLNFGDKKINLLDVSWYERYKPYGDSVISAILWVTYLHSLWRQIPGIIGGASGGISAANGIAVHIRGGSSGKGNK